MQTIIDRDTPIDEAERYFVAMGKAPDGARGLTRTLLALGLMTLVGVALVGLFVGDGNLASEPLKTVITSLTAALTTVVGFYFGSRSQSDGDKAATGGTKAPDASLAAVPPPAKGPEVLHIEPTSARAGDFVTLRGVGLGDVVAVLFGSTPVVGISSGDTAYTCAAPSGHGTVDVRAVTAHAASAVSERARFTFIEAS